MKMKTKTKFLYKVIAVLAFIVAIAILLMVPPIYNWVANKTGVAAMKIRDTAATVAGVGVGIIFIAIGIAAIAAAPIVGLVLIGIGLAIVGYSVWRYLPWSTNTVTMTAKIGDPGLQKIMGTSK